ncbi:MAG TPA: hypothetical protein VNH11_15510 [Pirellulales bacterium]|nr:hypothetical protein [Pirellulales bacterium]
MIDAVTQKRLCVSTEGAFAPFVVVPLNQLDTVLAALDANKLSYRLDDEVMSVDGKPEVAFVNLERGSDPVSVQRILDNIP